MSDLSKIQPAPTDVWVCLRSGVWNLTGDAPVEASATTRSIMRGLLQAALIALDEGHLACSICGHDPHGFRVCGYGRGEGPTMCGCAGGGPDER